jgi:hypothetical protein
MLSVRHSPPTLADLEKVAEPAFEFVPVCGFALPDHKQAPSEKLQFRSILAVARLVSFKLFFPKAIIRFRSAGAFAPAMTVPETSMHEDGDLS